MASRTKVAVDTTTHDVTSSKALELAPSTTVIISPPNMMTASFTCIGTSPLVINRFSGDQHGKMRAAQEAGGQTKNKKTRAPKDFGKLFEDARYRSAEGWDGIHAAAFRLAMIGACRLVNYKMTVMKLSVFVLEDGRDKIDRTPLVRIHGPAPVMDVRPARNSDGSVDLRARPMWDEWMCKVKIRFDLDQFSLNDVTNLLSRVGLQCGMGEGRASSKMSAGIGWGHFRVES